MDAMKTPMLWGYEVQTCIDLPVKDGDTDYDSAVYRAFDCPTKREALSLAAKLLPDDKWGGVEVTEFIRELYDQDCPAAGWHKIYIGDTEYVGD